MLRKKLLSTMAVAATVTLLAGCPETPTVVDPPEETATPEPAETETPAPAETETPEPAETATPEPEETATPEPEETATPEPEETATPDPGESVEPTETPLPAATSDISTVEKTTFNGKVYDDTEAPLAGVTVKAKSLNSSVPFEAETTTAGGTYTFNNAPSGVQIEIIASKPGYTTRRRVEVLKSNKQGDPDANRYDFGTDGSETGFSADYNALSDLPEVTKVSPGRNASGVNPATSFVLTFSETMDTATVEDNFIIRSFTEEELTVDDETTFEAKDGDFEGGSDIWDDSSFDVDWNSDDTEVTLTFTEERQLPTDKDSENTPDYYVTMNNDDDQLKDDSGVTRDENYFKLTDGNFENYYKFSIQTDEDKPQVDKITAVTEENGADAGDEIRVTFSESMIFYTLSGEIAGGINGESADAAGAVAGVDSDDVAENYFVWVNDGEDFEDTWNAANSGNGIAIFDSDDETHKTVLLRLADPDGDVFQPGDKITVQVDTTVVDPAGNTVDSGDDEATATAS